MNKTTLINGVFSDYINVNDRAVQYGDGIFETILCDTRQLFYWQQHYQRLKLSAEKLKLSCPNEAILLADISKLLNENQFDDEQSIIKANINTNIKPDKNTNKNACVIKIIITRGESGRGYQFSKKSVNNRIILLTHLDRDYSSLLSRQLLSGNLCLCEQQVSINSNLAGLKHLNRLDNVMARNEWVDLVTDNFIIDGLMLNANKHIIEGSMSNLFAVKNNQLLTPDLSLSGVNGIMRNIVMTLAAENNINCSEVNLEAEELSSMDELFITNSLIGMKKVDHFDNTNYHTSEISNIIFEKLLATMNAHAKTV